MDSLNKYVDNHRSAQYPESGKSRWSYRPRRSPFQCFRDNFYADVLMNIRQLIFGTLDALSFIYDYIVRELAVDTYPTTCAVLKLMFHCMWNVWFMSSYENQTKL